MDALATPAVAAVASAKPPNATTNATGIAVDTAFKLTAGRSAADRGKCGWPGRSWSRGVRGAAELHSLNAGTDRPGMAQIALALARILDNPKAVGSQPAAANVLAVLLDKLRSASAGGRRGRLAVVRNVR